MARVTKTRKLETLASHIVGGDERAIISPRSKCRITSRTRAQSPGPYRLLPSAAQGARAVGSGSKSRVARAGAVLSGTRSTHRKKQMASP